MIFIGRSQAKEDVRRLCQKVFSTGTKWSCCHASNFNSFLIRNAHPPIFLTASKEKKIAFSIVN
jgi:hypothetical protein